VTGAPAHGFAAPADGVALVIAADIFGARVHHPSSRKRAQARDALLGGVSDFSQLSPGDYLVHQRHGVGRYHGLERLAVAGAANVETLKLEYDGGNLYLPVYRLGEVQRYVGAEGHAPKLDKLGGVTWEATRTKVGRHVRALAEELLQLYAQRASLPGHRFPEADDTYRELEATFPFDETPDQAAAIEAVLADMEAPRAMDRLVCGDVGYGKTEVAMRAVFRCVQGGKQACILAPTTVLVEQHYRTMAERFAGFGVNIGKLSRFQSKGDQIETVRKISEGKLDAVVGTHRVLSPDVRFKDLGLLVIDEEQRFGVAHKEKIKKSRTQVDVLTLTATPIPRTLHLAMANLRDLSIIATPPADRRAVRTFVSRVDDQIIREAITNELSRGGQIFFITPTIGHMPLPAVDPRLPNDSRPVRKKPRDDDRTIDEWAEYVRALVPSARVGIGHGSLSAEELEKVMVQFVAGELDVLVATTIVESGLDIPRANTMFVARADAFGLAQLYQLRGRIGRSRDRAYCYLLVPEPEHITEEARRRLETLQRFTELGAGFQIASQDLEIRGGGELLGAKQSGSIAAVGFDQYVRMLDQAVAELGGKPIHSEVDPELAIETPGFIPDDYVPDPGQRLELYKRLSAIETDDELAAVMMEISDRYGPLPGDVILLGELMGVKAIARTIGALALEISTVRVAIALMPDNPYLQPAIKAGFRKLPDGRLALAPPAPGGAAGARKALLAVVDAHR
jgi:transcription-repair coupling factor (superfamily II helicase)